jgi:hypothetical protein
VACRMIGDGVNDVGTQGVRRRGRARSTASSPRAWPTSCS